MQVKAFGEKNTEALQTRNGIGACDSAMDNKESAKGQSAWSSVKQCEVVCNQ